MRHLQFTTKEKAQMFDEIAACYFEANFGQMSKADIELMMFNFYIRKLIAESENADGTVDYVKCSDYKISRDLGITQQRVRNLKVRNQLVNPIEYDWKRSLSQLIKNARYDKTTQKITMNIPDPNLFLDIQNFIEEHGAYVERQLNSKMLQMRAEYFIDLLISLEPNENRDKILNEIQKQFHKSAKENAAFDRKNIGKSLLDGAVNVTTIASSICGMISAGNTIGCAIIQLLQ